MISINVTNFRKGLFGLLEQTVRYNEPIHISTKDGNAVLLSEEEYNGIVETLYLSSIPYMEKEIIDGINTPVDECIPEDEVEW